MKPILYRGKEDFTVEERLGDVEYFALILKRVVRRYGLSEPPDLEELLRITKKIINHIESMRYYNAIGYPVYPNIRYNIAIKKIAYKMIEIATKKLEGQSYHDLYNKIIEDFNKEEKRYEWDERTR